MSTSHSPIRFSTHVRLNDLVNNPENSKEFEAAAQILEGLIPHVKGKQERQLCQEVADCYRSAAKRLLRRAWSEERGQDIAEYAVMLAVILVIVVGTLRLIGSNANNVFSQAASSIQ
jgi:Flp pilus assembly pilin Flp